MPVATVQVVSRRSISMGKSSKQMTDSILLFRGNSFGERYTLYIPSRAENIQQRGEIYETTILSWVQCTSWTVFWCKRRPPFSDSTKDHGSQLGIETKPNHLITTKRIAVQKVGMLGSYPRERLQKNPSPSTRQPILLKTQQWPMGIRQLSMRKYVSFLCFCFWFWTVSM